MMMLTCAPDAMTISSTLNDCQRKSLSNMLEKGEDCHYNNKNNKLAFTHIQTQTHTQEIHTWTLHTLSHSHTDRHVHRHTKIPTYIETYIDT